MPEGDPNPDPDADSGALWTDQAIPRNHGIALCAFIVTFFLLMILLLFGFWPQAGTGNNWEAGFRWLFWPAGGKIDPSQRLVITVLICSGIGAQVHTIASFAFHMARRDFSRDWIYWYILRPFQGAIVAFVVYFVFAAGLAGELTSSADTDVKAASKMAELYRAGAIAALVGMFSESAVEKLREIANTVLARPKPKAEREKTPEPALSADPNPIKAAENQTVLLRGRALDRVSKVEIGPQTATLASGSEKRNPASLTVTVDGGVLGAGRHKITLDGKDTGRSVQVNAA